MNAEAIPHLYACFPLEAAKPFLRSLDVLSSVTAPRGTHETRGQFDVLGRIEELESEWA